MNKLEQFLRREKLLTKFRNKCNNILDVKNYMIYHEFDRFAIGKAFLWAPDERFWMRVEYDWQDYLSGKDKNQMSLFEQFLRERHVFTYLKKEFGVIWEEVHSNIVENKEFINEAIRTTEDSKTKDILLEYFKYVK